MLYVVLTYLCWPVLRMLTRARGRGIRPSAGPVRYLVVQTAKIGDLVYATAVWQSIKAAYPNAHVALLTHPAAAPLVAHDPRLGTVHTIDAAGLRGLRGKWRLARLVRQGRYDVALGLTPTLGLAVGLLWGLVPRVVLLVPGAVGVTFRAMARLVFRVGHRPGEPLGAAYTRVLAAGRIAGDARKRALTAAPAAEARAREFLNARGMGAETKLVGIAPATGNPVKQWPADRVAVLAERIAAWPGVWVLLIGSGADRALGASIREAVPPQARERVIDATGAFFLDDLPALIRACALLVAGDSGPLHIAEAMDVPAVIIGGPADLRERDLRMPHILVQKNLPCLPCVSAFAAPYACPLGHHRCIQDTTVAEVWSAARAMLERLVPVTRHPVKAEA